MIKMLIKILVAIFLINNSVAKAQYKYINIGFSKVLLSDVEYNDAIVSIDLWVKELIANNTISYSIHTQVFESEEEIVESYKNGKLDFIATTSVEYLNLRNKIKLTPLVNPLSYNKLGHEFILVTKNPKIKNIKDLKNKSLAIPINSYATISRYWLEELVKIENNKKNSNNFFSKITYHKKASQPLLSVFFGNSDACLIRKETLKTMNELNPQIKQELKVIKVSPPYLVGIICANNNTKPEYVSDFVSIVTKLRANSSGKLLNSMFGIVQLRPHNKEFFLRTEKLILNNRIDR